jgi:hypothetical protein
MRLPLGPTEVPRARRRVRVGQRRTATADRRGGTRFVAGDSCLVGCAGGDAGKVIWLGCSGGGDTYVTVPGPACSRWSPSWELTCGIIVTRCGGFSCTVSF